MNSKYKSRYIGLIISFILILNPSFNMIDPLPDFIAYFFFAWLIGTAGEIVPYLAEVRSAAIKLGFVTLVRIPSAMIMLTNMYAGRDIVPLFTLIFSVIEAILLYSLVTNLFHGLYYMGERCAISRAISDFTAFGRKISPDTLKLTTLSFVLTKSVLNVIPEICLLTTENPTLKKFFTAAYPPLLIVCLFAVLIFGIIWAYLAWRYAKAIYNDKSIADAVRELAGEEKLALLENKKRISIFTSTLTVLAVSTLFSFDIAPDNTGGVNIVPHFLFGALMLYVGVRLFEGKWLKLGLAISELAYTVFSILAHYFTISFLDAHTMLELLDRKEAQAAYIPVEVFSALEALSFLALILFMVIGFSKFLRTHTGIAPESSGYNSTERAYHSNMIVKAACLFGLAMLIQLLKCVKVFLDSKVELIFTETDMIVTSPAPWLGWVTLGLSVLLVGYAFYYLSDVKSDVRFKYDKEEKETKRGLYE